MDHTSGGHWHKSSFYVQYQTQLSERSGGEDREEGLQNCEERPTSSNIKTSNKLIAFKKANQKALTQRWPFQIQFEMIQSISTKIKFLLLSSGDHCY